LAIFIRDAVHIVYKHEFQELTSIQAVFLYKALVNEDFSSTEVTKACMDTDLVVSVVSREIGRYQKVL